MRPEATPTRAATLRSVMAESPCSSAISLAASAISAARSAGVFLEARFCTVLDITQQSRVVFHLIDHTINKNYKHSAALQGKDALSSRLPPQNPEESSMAWRMPAETA